MHDQNAMWDQVVLNMGTTIMQCRTGSRRDWWVSGSAAVNQSSMPSFFNR